MGVTQKFDLRVSFKLSERPKDFSYLTGKLFSYTFKALHVICVVEYGYAIFYERKTSGSLYL